LFFCRDNRRSDLVNYVFKFAPQDRAYSQPPIEFNEMVSVQNQHLSLSFSDPAVPKASPSETLDVPS
jgi:hypothetical protein